LTSANPNTHVVPFDYRGWGYSTGTPSEEGIITDGLTVLDWVINTAHVDPSRILIVSQSLGTAIAMGVATKYHESHQDQPLAGIVMVASFTSLQNVVGAYRMAGIIPLLGPLNMFPKLIKFFTHQFLRTELDSAERMGRLVRMTMGTSFSVTLVHATNDREIPCQHSRELFDIARTGDHRIIETVSSDKVTREIENGRIRYIETTWGGHNDIQKGDAVVKAVLSAWR
jgi:abhydrolase domain-containing protein 12